MVIFVTIAVIVSHGLALLPFLRKLRAGKLPDTVDFAVLSVILFYDVGLVFESFGYVYESRLLSSMFSADDRVIVIASVYLIAAPWVFLAGSQLVDRGGGSVCQEPSARLEPERKPLFMLISVMIVLPMAVVGTRGLLTGDSIWSARQKIGAEWGPWIIVLYLPLHILAFFVRQRDSWGWAGRGISFAFAAAAILSTLSIGQRTNALLPIMILAIFSTSLSVARISIIAAAALAGAALLLPVFKWQYAEAGSEPNRLITDTVNSDLARAPVLAAAIEASEPIGTRVLPFPMSGYVYSALFFVPRPLAPIKGVPAAMRFTAYLAGSNPEETDWLVGVGVIEEICLNAGYLAVLPFLLIHGAVLGWLNRISTCASSVVVPTRLAALWICAHHLPALLMIFGTMVGTAWLLQLVFSEECLPETSRGPDPPPNPVRLHEVETSRRIEHQVGSE